MINGDKSLDDSLSCCLKVIPVQNWGHHQSYVLPIRPSLNLPTYQSVRLYPSLCLFEGIAMSIGRGTEMPFEAIGYPNPRLGEFYFVPSSVPKARRYKHINLRCYVDCAERVVSPLTYYLILWFTFLQGSHLARRLIAYIRTCF